jgi:hypothetical protein
MSDDQFQFDTNHDSAVLNYLNGVRQAKQAGKGMLAMLLEIAKLQHFSPGRLRPDEYFMYGLYDDERYTPEVKKTFLSNSFKFFQSPWMALAEDKPMMSATLKGLGLPVPETQALVHPSRSLPGAVPLRSQDDVCRFLREQAEYPVFGKPFNAACSLGTAKITGYDREHDAVMIGGGELIPVDAFAKMIEDLDHDYLFQTLMLPNPEIVKLIGPCVSCVRMFVIYDEQGCTLHRAAWKIPADANHADNFWRPGNMVAGIDVDTGRITKAMLRTSAGIEPIQQHPLTGVEFDSMSFPQWDEMRETVLAAAVNFSGSPFQGWDVAMTDRGPVLVELEADGGDPILEQICFESGLFDERYQRLLEQYQQAAKQDHKRRRARGAADLKKRIAALAIARPAATAAEESNGTVPTEKPLIAPVTTAAPIDTSVNV